MDKSPLSQVKRKKILVYSQVIWDDVWQRPQEFAMGASRYADVVYYAPVPWHRYLKVHKKRMKPFRKVRGNVHVYSPRILPGHYRCPAVKKINERFLHRHLKSLHRRYQFDLCITNSPFVSFFLDLFRDIPVIYDVIDDFIRFSWAPASAPREEQLLFQEASLCFTGTRTLYERKKRFHNDIHFIPCGVHFEKFYQQKGEMPADLKDIPRPVIGYFGTISDRLNRNLIRKIADHFSNASIVLIGPVQSSFGSLIEKPNIHYVGLKPHDELPLYLKEFSVCILPFNMDEGTKSINPVKLLEFLSGGKIVVSTPIPDVVYFYKGIVFLAEKEQEFIEVLERQLQNPDEKRIQAGIELARRRSWKAMVEEMLRRAEIL